MKLITKEKAKRRSLHLKSLSKRKWELIKSYAIAQSIIGIDKTLKVKRRIVGYEPLSKASVNKLNLLIEKLRKIYTDENT